MATIEQSLDVEVPIETAYNQWTQFEEFPQFMDGVEEVRQLDDRRLHWVADFGGSRHEWDAEITEQIPGGARRVAQHRRQGQRRRRDLPQARRRPHPRDGADGLGARGHQGEDRRQARRRRPARQGRPRALQGADRVARHESGAWRGEVPRDALARARGAAPLRGASRPRWPASTRHRCAPAARWRVRRARMPRLEAHARRALQPAARHGAPGVTGAPGPGAGDGPPRARRRRPASDAAGGRDAACDAGAEIRRGRSHAEQPRAVGRLVGRMRSRACGARRRSSWRAVQRTRSGAPRSSSGRSPHAVGRERAVVVLPAVLVAHEAAGWKENMRKPMSRQSRIDARRPGRGCAASPSCCGRGRGDPVLALRRRKCSAKRAR